MAAKIAAIKIRTIGIAIKARLFCSFPLFYSIPACFTSHVPFIHCAPFTVHLHDWLAPPGDVEFSGQLTHELLEMY